MFPKIAAALSRALDPISPGKRETGSTPLAKSSDGGEGGYGSLGYSALEKQGGESESSPENPEDSVPEGEEHPEKKHAVLPFQPGLTQVILDLHSAKRAEVSSGSAAQTYETGAKEQKTNAHLPKGSMLDKKAG